MKKIIILILLIISFNSNKIIAQTYKLNYEPKGKIVKIIYDSLTFYTDTTILLGYNSYFIYMGVDVSLEKGLELVRNHIKENKNDTIIFTKSNVVFCDNDVAKTKRYWYVWYTLQKLIEDKNVKIFDKHNQQVKYLYVNKSGSRFKGKITTQYINWANKEVLKEETLYYKNWLSRIF